MKVSSTFLIELSNDERLLLRDTIDAAIPHLERVLAKVKADPRLSVKCELCDGKEMVSHIVSRVCCDGVSLLQSIFSDLGG